MTEVHRLAPHDPLPDERRHHALVLQHFAEDAPRQTVIEIVLVTGSGARDVRPGVRPDGSPMAFDEAIEVARRLARQAGVPLVYAVDRTAGAREQDILRHHGDHTVHMDRLQDTDPEDGERGPDMRDRQP